MTINSANTATYTTSTLATGSHAISALYGGDAHVQTNTSPTGTQTVK